MRQLIVYPMMEVDIMLDGSAVKGPTRYGILSLDFLLQALRLQCPLESWKDGMRATMRKPLVTVHAYNNTMLELVAETEVELECGGPKHMRATVMIHDVAPQKLLLC